MTRFTSNVAKALRRPVTILRILDQGYIILVRLDPRLNTTLPRVSRPGTRCHLR